MRTADIRQATYSLCWLQDAMTHILIPVAAKRCQKAASNYTDSRGNILFDMAQVHARIASKVNLKAEELSTQHQKNKG